MMIKAAMSRSANHCYHASKQIQQGCWRVARRFVVLQLQPSVHQEYSHETGLAGSTQDFSEVN